jgi:CelD/BcsL family acetyltransferase involved in cellulose biosynthesis
VTTYRSDTGVTTYRTIASQDDLEALHDQWDELVRSAPRPCPFFTEAWLGAWWQHHGAARRMLVEAAFDGDRLVGAVPIEVERRRGTDVVHFMGRHHAALADVLVAPGQSATVASTLLDRALGQGDYADLFGLPQRGEAHRTLEGRVAFIERIEAPVIDLTPGWDEVYRSRTSSKRRNLHRRRRKQLDAEGGLTVRIARDPETLARDLESAFALHDLRWEGRPDGSEFTTPVGREFHRAAIARLADHDMARILTLEVGGRPVAFHYYILFDRCMYVHRLAFDPALGRFSPGLIATLDAIEAAAAEGATRVEFLGGGERYKVELADRLEPLLQCIGLATTARGTVGAAIDRTVVDTRLRLKQHDFLRRAYASGIGRTLGRVTGRPAPDGARTAE